MRWSQRPIAAKFDTVARRVDDSIVEHHHPARAGNEATAWTFLAAIVERSSWRARSVGQSRLGPDAIEKQAGPAANFL
ncbi:hypothetical protein [Aureimonas sp. D3]|uniref:hypothetical protein n=1 Tax=Aureimonas sp. D3 TaxID=1638164 RepID=UPI0007809364|nr:hypothetical protein [Aureimonas sp. D3]